MRRERIEKSRALALCSTALALMACLVLYDVPARAAGVKHVHFGPALTLCTENQFQPCGDYQGLGNSNTLEVHQTEIGGQLVYDELHVDGIPDGHLWVAASYGAKCKAGWSLHDAEITLGILDAHVNGTQLEFTSYWEGWPIPYSNGNRTIPGHVVDMWVPIEHVLDPGSEENHLWGFPTEQSIYDYAESVVQSRIDGGMTEGQARALPFEEQSFLLMHGKVTCMGNTFGRVKTRATSALLPVTIEFVGNQEAEELQLDDDPPEPPSNDLVVETAVVQAHLSVMQDPADSCRLALSGVIVTNDTTQVAYRFVNQAGAKSQIFTTNVDQTFTALLDHYVEIPAVAPVESEPGLDGLVADGRGEIGGLVQEESDNFQGTYTIEVLEPHSFQSNVAGFNVEPCIQETFVAWEALPVPALPPPPRPSRNRDIVGGPATWMGR